MDDLLPCPFCGAGETRFHESTHWTGLSQSVISVRIHHWCPREEGQPSSHMEIAGRTRADAIAKWNTRAAPPAALAVPEVDWRALYRFQTAMRYMDADAKLTREKAYAMADKDVAAMLAAALAERNNTGDNP